MAKTDTAETKTPAPAKADAAALSAKSTVPLASAEYTEAQRDPDSFSHDELIGIFGTGPKAEKPADEPKKAKKIDETKGEKAKETPIKEEKEKADSEKEEAPLIPDDDEAKAEIEGDDDEDASKGELERLRFEKRELKRQLKADAEIAKAKIAELEAKSKETAATTHVPEAEGYFKGVKTLKEVDDRVANLEKWEAFYEDNEDGYAAQDGTEYDRKAVKQALRGIRAEIKKAPDLKKSFADLDARKEAANAKAKKLFPWASDPSSKHHQIVLDLVKEHPEAARAPDSAVVLGLMALGKMVESGKYKLVLASPAAAKEKDEPARRRADPPAPRKQAAASEESEDDDLSRMRSGDQYAADRLAFRVFAK